MTAIVSPLKDESEVQDGRDDRARHVRCFAS